jgi:hypothetical protein
MVILKGIVVPAAWDLDGNIVQLAIATGDEQEYLIENNRKIGQLKTLLRQEVVVRGSLGEKKQYKTIKVASISQEKTI